jgi:hypothetical protein
MANKYITATVLTGALLGAVSAAHAQSASLVNVDLRNARILNNLAKNLSVDITNVPITVQVPLALAATVCEVDVDVLTASLDRGPTVCAAQSTSNALDRKVLRVINLSR